MGMTIVAIARGMNEKLLAFVESRTGLGIAPERLKELNPRPMGFGSAGGFYGTNAGVVFTKKELLALANAMEDGSELRIAACNTLNMAEATGRPDVQSVYIQ